MLCSYPEALRRHVHATNVYVPLDIAKALTRRPALVQRAVEAFYTRDAVQLRVEISLFFNLDGSTHSILGCS